MALISISEAALAWPLSAKHIRYLAACGTIKAQKFGTSWAVDERSLKEVGRWPWARDKQAQLVKTIAADGPRVIGLLPGSIT